MALGKFKETLLGIKSKVKENKFGRKNKTVVSRKNKRQNLQQLKEEESEARFKKSLKKMKLSSKNFSREEKKRVHELISQIFNKPLKRQEMDEDVNNNLLYNIEKNRAKESKHYQTDLHE